MERNVKTEEELVAAWPCHWIKQCPVPTIALSCSRLDVAVVIADSPHTEKQSMQADNYMKHIFILTLALGLIAGCGAKDEQAVAEKTSGAKLDAGESEDALAPLF